MARFLAVAPVNNKFPTMTSVTKPRVLLVDDHKLITGSLAYLMELRHWQVVGQLTSAKNFQWEVANRKPDIIVADIVMPGPSILTEYAHYATRDGDDPKLVVLSAHFTDYNLLSAYDAGASGIISKEDSPEEVLDGIEAVYFGEKYYSDNLIMRLTDCSNPDRRRSLGIENLTPREQEVLILISQGHPIKKIAENLNIAVKTVDRHRTNLMAKLRCHSQVELVRYAIKEGILVP